MKEENKLYKDRYFWLLCVSMSIVSIGLYYNFIIGERLYIYNDTGRDTITAYWPFYKYLLEAMKAGNLYGWSFSLGLGNNTFSIMWWLLDPFNIILLPLSVDSIPYGFVFVMITKIFTSGIFFYLYLSKIRVKNLPAVIAALAWAFNGYMILWGQHYLFATTVVLFTITMYGIEKMISENKKTAFVIGIFLLITNSSYMAYFVSLFIAVYILTRYFMLYKFNCLKIIGFIWGFLKAYLLGFALGAFSFLPSAYLIINSARLDGIGKKTPTIFWDLSNYIGSISRLFSNNLLGINGTILSRNYYSFAMLGSTILVIILLPQIGNIIITKRDKIIAVCIGSMLLLAVGTKWPAYVMNAFNNTEMRWSFVVIFVLVTILGLILKNIMDTKTVNSAMVEAQVILSIFLLGFTLLLAIKTGINAVDTSYILNLIAILLVIVCLMTGYNLILKVYSNSKHNTYMYVLLALVIIELIVNNYRTINTRVYITPDYIGSMKGYYDGTSQAINKIQSIEKDRFYRIEKTYNSQDANDSLMQNYMGTKFYNALSMKNYYYLMRDMNKIPGTNKNRVWAINDSSQFESLLGVKYMLSRYELNKPNY